MNQNIKGWTEIEAGKEQGHTALPWHVGCHGGSKVQIITVDANEEPNGLIAEINGLISIKAGEDIGDEAKANARFICKAVNCHDDLVEALRRLISDHEQGLDFEISWSLAKAILKKAGEA